MKSHILISFLLSCLAFHTFALEIDDNSDLVLLDNTIAPFPYPTLPSNGCPSEGEFGKGHFGNGANPIDTCQGSTNPALGALRIYRGGNPNRNGITCLQSLGVKAIFDLRTESVIKEAGSTNSEEMLAKNAGIQYFSFPMEVMSNTPGSRSCADSGMNSSQCNQQSIESFIRTVRQFLSQNPNAKIYVHCARGQDRTGLAMAFFRVKIQGCSKELARQEMLSYRYNPTKPLEAVWNNIDQLDL